MQRAASITRLRFVARPQHRISRAGIDAARAASASVSSRKQRPVRSRSNSSEVHNHAQQQPRPLLLVQHACVFAYPSDARARRIVALHNRPGVDIATRLAPETRENLCLNTTQLFQQHIVVVAAHAGLYAPAFPAPAFPAPGVAGNPPRNPQEPNRSSAAHLRCMEFTAHTTTLRAHGIALRRPPRRNSPASSARFRYSISPAWPACTHSAKRCPATTASALSSPGTAATPHSANPSACARASIHSRSVRLSFIDSHLRRCTQPLLRRSITISHRRSTSPENHPMRRRTFLATLPLRRRFGCHCPSERIRSRTNSF